MDELGRGRGLVSRLVASDITGPQFESSHRQTFIWNIYLIIVNCIEKTKVKEKRPRMVHFSICKILPFASRFERRISDMSHFDLEDLAKHFNIL